MCVGDVRKQLRLGVVGSVVHQTRGAQEGGLDCMEGGVSYVLGGGDRHSISNWKSSREGSLKSNKT